MTVSFVGSSVRSRLLPSATYVVRIRDPTAPRAPLCPRAAFAVLFHAWNANPKSMIPKISMKSRLATIANSTAAAPRSPWIRPRREPACAGRVPSSWSAGPWSTGVRCELVDRSLTGRWKVCHNARVRSFQAVFRVSRNALTYFYVRGHRVAPWSDPYARRADDDRGEGSSPSPSIGRSASNPEGSTRCGEEARNGDDLDWCPGWDSNPHAPKSKRF